MLDYWNSKQPGFYWFYPTAQEQQPVIVEVGGEPGAQSVYFTGKSEPMKLEDLAGELVGPIPFVIS